MPKRKMNSWALALQTLRQLWRDLSRHFNNDGYYPERHYMRGPGPKWREKYREQPTAGANNVAHVTRLGRV